MKNNASEDRFVKQICFILISVSAFIEAVYPSDLHENRLEKKIHLYRDHFF